MIISQHEQGTPEWETERIGKFTASCFNKILSPIPLKNGNFNSSKDIYFYKIAAERLSGEVYSAEEDNAKSFEMERGCDLEAKAVKEYEFMNNVKVDRVGLCTPCKDALVGASPDGLVGDNGGLEIKSPSLYTHLKYCAEKKLPSQYIGQVYGCLFISARDWWDFMSYHPFYEPFITRVHAWDEAYLNWSKAFLPVLDELILKLQKYEKYPLTTPPTGD